MSLSESQESSPGPQQWGLWLAVAAALALRLFHLGHQSLWVDEIFTWLTAYPHDPLPFVELLDDLHGPGVSWFLHGWIRLFGDSEFSLRLPMALASSALVPVVAWIARAAGGPRAFLPGAWLAAVSPFFVWYGQESRNYAFAMLFGAIQVWATLRYHRSGSARDLALLAAGAILGALSNLNSVLLFPALLVLLVIAPSPAARGAGTRRWIAPAAVALAVALVLSPWLLTHFGLLDFGRLVPGRVEPPSESPLRGATTFSWAAIPYTLYTYSVGFSLGPALRELRAHAGLSALAPHLPVILAAAAVFGALAVSGLRQLAARRFALVALVVAIAVPILAVSYFALMNFKPYNPRYASVGAPAWIALLAVGWSGPAPTWRRVARLWVFGLWAVALAHHYFDPRYAKDDFRALTRDLARDVRPGDRIVAAGNMRPFEYYWQGREPEVAYYWLGWALDDRRAGKFELLRAPSGTTWVTVSREWDLDPGGKFDSWLADSLHAEVRRYAGVRLYRVPPAGSER